MKPAPPTADQSGQMSLIGAISIGIGGMVGAGIFSILGVAAKSAGNALWFSFLIGGVAALLSTYSYAKLGATFPSAGGAVKFLTQGLGDGVLSGGINVFMWIGYVMALALYANAFGAYGAKMIDPSGNPWVVKALAIGAIALFTLVNARGARSVGRSETLIVGIKVGILILFAIGGAFSIQPARLAVSQWPAFPDIMSGAGIVFMGYEGFGLVANSAGNMANPQKMLPRALYLSVAIVIVIYLSVSVSVLGNLSIDQMVATKDYALAAAAQGFLGQFGFTLIGLAALLSTASAMNATLFGSANVCFLIARDGQLPEGFTRRAWGQGSVGLFLTAGLVVGFVLLFDLSGIAMMSSAAFLLIYAAVNASHLRLTQQTGGNRVIIVAAILSCLVMFGYLMKYTYLTQPAALYAMITILAISFAGEAAYRRFSGRKIQI